MALTITLSFNDNMSKELSKKIDVFDRDVLRSYLILLVKKDIEAKE